MRRRGMLIVCCALLLGPSLLAEQARSTKPPKDAVTGTWTGEMVTPNASQPAQITLELTLGAKGIVTGTLAGLPEPGDVKKGSFDPKTGALKLELGKTSAPTVLLTLEGTVADNKATGHVTGDGSKGEFKLARKP